jgi:hypothetical protein
VGEQDTSRTKGREQLGIVGQSSEAEIARRDDVVAGCPKRSYEVQGNVVIEVEAGQARP